MNDNKKIIYTETAKQRLENFHIEVDKELEYYFSDKKFVPGDDFIEITASDIDEVSSKFKIVSHSKTSIKRLIPALYSTMGILMTVVGVFFEQFKTIIEGNPIRLVFIIGGVLMVFISWFYLYIVKIREQRDFIEEKERIMYETEQKNRQLK